MAKYIGQLGEFGDARRAVVGDRLIERVVETGSLVIRTLGGDRAGEIEIHRFLSAPSVILGLRHDPKFGRVYNAEIVSDRIA